MLGEQARDQRALRALGEGGLLPEPAEIEDVLRVLEAAGITAYSGWRYLAMLPAEARTGWSTAAAPGRWRAAQQRRRRRRARDELAVARGCCRAPWWPSGPPPRSRPTALRPGVEFVVPPNPAMVDEDAAAEVRAELDRDDARRSADLESLAAGLDADRDLLARFAAWRDRRPTVGELADAADAAAVRSTRAAARAEAADARVAELDARADPRSRPAAAGRGRRHHPGTGGGAGRPGRRDRAGARVARPRPVGGGRRRAGRGPRRGRPGGGRAGPRGGRRGAAPRGPPHRRGRARPRRARRAVRARDGALAALAAGRTRSAGARSARATTARSSVLRE